MALGLKPTLNQISKSVVGVKPTVRNLGRRIVIVNPIVPPFSNIPADSAGAWCFAEANGGSQMADGQKGPRDRTIPVWASSPQSGDHTAIGQASRVSLSTTASARHTL